MSKFENMVPVAKLQEMIGKKECKGKKVLLWILAIVGAVAAIAAIAYAVYRFLTPDYLEDFEDDFEDDFDEDFMDDCFEDDDDEI